MKFAICNEMFESWPIEDIFKEAKDAGYEAVEIAPFTLAEDIRTISLEKRQEIRKVAESCGMKILGLHWLLVSPEGLHINHPDETVRRRTEGYLGALIDFCADLGGEILVFGSPKQRGKVEGQSYEEAWRLARESFSAVLNQAADRGVIIALEPLAPTEAAFFTTADEVIKFIREVGHPHLRLHLDAKAMMSEARPIPQIIEEAAANLAHFHANDANRRGPGFGDTDFLPIFRALQKINYQGFVSVEVFDFKPDPVTIAKKSMEYMQKCLKEA